MKRFLLVGAGIALAGVGVFLLNGRAAKSHKQQAPLTPEHRIARELSEVDTAAGLRGLIRKYEDSPQRDVQTQVTRARLKLGYVTAKREGYAQAKAVFQEAVREHKGSNESNPDWGGLVEQARYQAIVCDENSGRKSEALAAYRALMDASPTSPIATACMRRIKRLNGGVLGPEDERAYEAARQEVADRYRKELARCGPRSVARVATILGQKTPTLELVETACGTNSEGTTLEGMVEGLSANGIRAVAKELNSKDFRTLKTPAIWLDARHYRVIESMSGDAATVYDPLDQRTHSIPLPATETEHFRAIVLELTLKKTS